MGYRVAFRAEVQPLDLSLERSARKGRTILQAIKKGAFTPFFIFFLASYSLISAVFRPVPAVRSTVLPPVCVRVGHVVSHGSALQLLAPHAA